MEYQKITNLLGNIPDKVPRFITKKWKEVHDQSGTGKDRYKPSKQLRFNTSVLRSDLRATSKKLAFKNNAPFNSGITKINNTLINNAEDLDIVMPIYYIV